MRRRRRGAKAIAVEADSEQSLAMRILLRNPKDVVVSALAFAAVVAIVTNALFLQAGRHPAPMFGSVTVMPVAAPANPLPRSRPVEADSAQLELRPAEPKSVDQLTNLVKTTGAVPVMPTAVPRPPAAIPVYAEARRQCVVGLSAARGSGAG